MNDHDAKTLICGVRAVEALLREPARIRTLWHASGSSDVRSRILERAQALGITTQPLSPDRLTRLTDGIRHQGLIAEVTARPPAEWEALIQTPEPLILAFDQVTDPHNLGAALRSAEALGATGALVTRNRSARPGPVVARTSAGASEIIPVAVETNLARALDQARTAGLRVIGADLDGVPSDQADLTGPLVVVLGSEGAGLRRLTRDRCDLMVCIPLTGLTESLNASVAASIVLYEATRQRRAAAERRSEKKLAEGP